MNLVAITDTPLTRPLAYIRSVLSLVRRQPKSQEDSEKESRERREFILEMMMTHPDAFQSELDCRTMMHFYPSRF